MTLNVESARSDRTLYINRGLHPDLKEVGAFNVLDDIYHKYTLENPKDLGAVILGYANTSASRKLSFSEQLQLFSIDLKAKLFGVDNQTLKAMEDVIHANAEYQALAMFWDESAYHVTGTGHRGYHAKGIGILATGDESSPFEIVSSAYASWSRVETRVNLSVEEQVRRAFFNAHKVESSLHNHLYPQFVLDSRDFSHPVNPSVTKYVSRLRWAGQ